MCCHPVHFVFNMGTNQSAQLERCGPAARINGMTHTQTVGWMYIALLLQNAGIHVFTRASRDRPPDQPMSLELDRDYTMICLFLHRTARCVWGVQVCPCAHMRLSFDQSSSLEIYFACCGRFRTTTCHIIHHHKVQIIFFREKKRINKGGGWGSGDYRAATTDDIDV